MKSFQSQDSFHLHIMLSQFSSFKGYHIEVFQKEYKKIIYSSNQPSWHQHYIKKQFWNDDPILKYAEEHDYGVYLFTWPENFFKERSTLNLTSGFCKLAVSDNFIQMIHVCPLHENNLDIIINIFDDIELLLGEKDEGLQQMQA
jgi:hypothetical protein